jgi:MoaA/NifB/PqqE/SkfB family radical SAM enzyme
MYNPEDDLPIEVIDQVISEAKDMGMYNVYILGGEPFIRQDMLDIYQQHSDVFFQVFTNGTLFDAELVKKLSQFGNVVPLISIEGFEREVDAFRGKGVFQKVMDGMDSLHRRGVPFGYSSLVSRFNVDTVISDEFNDMLIDKGCFLGWHFLYIPIGRRPNPRLMPTPEQRLKMYRAGASRIRTYKKALVFDFWNDAPYIGGCIAGGKHYFHINAQGDVEPCIFIHFAVDNVKEKPLKECLKSPFFKAFRDRQPYSENLLRPCAIIDHPHILREILAEFHPHPTHPESDVLVTKCSDALDKYAEKVAQLLDPVWEQDFASKGYECNFFASIVKASREKYVREKHG